MTKPWQETWDPDDVVNMAAHVAYNPGRRKLAAAAPEMARLLLRVRASVAAMITEDADLFLALDEDIAITLRNAGVE